VAQLSPRASGTPRWAYACLPAAARGELTTEPSRVDILEAEARRLRDVIETYATLLAALAEPCPCIVAAEAA
jgi:hypothetical protein